MWGDETFIGGDDFSLEPGEGASINISMGLPAHGVHTSVCSGAFCHRTSPQVQTKPCKVKATNKTEALHLRRMAFFRTYSNSERMNALFI